MAGHVISHRKPRRKRGGAGSFVLRRFGALAVTVGALGTASWLAPYYYRPPPATLRINIAEAPVTAPKLPPPSEAAKLARFNGAARIVIEAQRSRRTRRGVPLDARPQMPGEDFEVLSAHELEAISQAPN